MAVLLLIKLAALTSEPAKLLTASAGLATLILMLAAIYSAGLVLWGGHILSM